MTCVADELVLLFGVFEQQHIGEVSLELRELLERPRHDLVPLEDQIVKKVDGRSKGRKSFNSVTRLERN